jgi:hypothetical protein
MQGATHKSLLISGREQWKPASYRTCPDHSIPWCAILDDEGTVLTNWDSPDGNIGFPNEPKYIEHFLKALAATAPRLTPAQVEELRQALKAKR